MSFSRHWLLFKLAIVFLSRLPVPLKQDINDDDINQATGYFALAGVVLGALCLLPLVLYPALSASICVVLIIICSLMLTGAFHEDGLADTFDGLGGGWTPQQKLTIMKDSRLGTYGAAALFCGLLLKFLLLTELLQFGLEVFAAVFIAAQALSRITAVSIIPALNYVQIDGESKTKPVAQSLSGQSRSVLVFSGLAVVLLLLGFSPISVMQLAILLLVLIGARSLFIIGLRRQLGGYNGDTLGASQQLSELIIYLTCLLLWAGANG